MDRVRPLNSSYPTTELTPPSFVDPSKTIPSDPSLPLSHFLPPSSFPSLSTLTFIGTKSNELYIDTSLFYIRVSSLSLRILTLAMATVYLDPQREWGEDVAGTALRAVVEREEYRDKVVWVPWGWWDGEAAAFVKSWASEGGLGLLAREKVLTEVEDRMDDDDNDDGLDVVPKREAVEAFWKLVGEARLVLDVAKKSAFQEEMRELRDVVELRTWDIRALRWAIENLKERLGLGDIVGFESVVE